MNNPLTLPLPTNQPTTLKRSRSSLEIFDISLPYDTKRARIGIQELTTNQPSSPSSSAWRRNSPSSRPEEPHSSSNSSSSELDSSEETSSSDDESSGIIDEGYDSDSESGSTTTTSSSSSSSEGEDTDDEDRASPLVTVAVNALRSPRGMFAGVGVSSEPASLVAKLSAFLPRMAAANAELEGERENGLLQDRDIEQVDDEGRYIEMDLGLGVLEERRGNGTSGSDNDGDESEDGLTSRSSGRNDTMAVLMGRKGTRKPDIQIVET